jgi:hypothetical protein
MLLLNECLLLLLFISLSTQSGNFWILPRKSRSHYHIKVYNFYSEHFFTWYIFIEIRRKKRFKLFLIVLEEPNLVQIGFFVSRRDVVH